MAPEDWQPRLSSDCHTHTQAWAPAHTWTYTSLETHAKQFEFDDCIRCVLTGILFWSEPLINARCLFTTWPQTYRSNDSSQWPVIKLFCMSLNILQHVLRMLLWLAIMAFIMHLSFTRANADTSELVFVLLLSCMHPVVWACYNTLIDLPCVFIAF